VERKEMRCNDLSNFNIVVFSETIVDVKLKELQRANEQLLETVRDREDTLQRERQQHRSETEALQAKHQSLLVSIDDKMRRVLEQKQQEIRTTQEALQVERQKYKELTLMLQEVTHS
jgi:hypothetical protein